ncbi:MAG TPA: YdiU family protein [Bosea sp. (in: a-proteobacteria)]
MPIAFDNSYARLPERFFALTPPTPVSAPRLVRLNDALAEELGLDHDWLASPGGLAMLAGNAVAAGSTPIATAYAGHQFGQFVPQLGDGRAILLGEVVDRSGTRRDIQLKGAGRTRFSRGGDGRAALGPVMREYIVSEAMAALGIPTTRALAFVLTGEPVMREEALPGAILTRVAKSHIRVGTFQFFAVRQDAEALRALADHIIDRHYPQAASAANPYLAVFEAVIAAQADLIVRWLSVGFIHGVMNTDNCSIAGETIDYGPCAFLDAYDPATVFSSIDVAGRYAYGNQPSIALWNLTRLAEALLPLLDADTDAAVALAQNALGAFAPRFQAGYDAAIARKLGLHGDSEADTALGAEFLGLLATHGADFTLSFRHLARLQAGAAGEEPLRMALRDDPAVDGWLERWRERSAGTEPGAMLAVNPAYIPRNHRVEAAIRAAQEHDDFAPFEELLTVLAQPFDERAEFAEYENPPRPEERVRATFCGT